MTNSKTALERAFELAQTGGFDAVGRLKRTLSREGNNLDQIDWRHLQGAAWSERAAGN
jgi:hypothetical protein